MVFWYREKEASKGKDIYVQEPKLAQIDPLVFWMLDYCIQETINPKFLEKSTIIHLSVFSETEFTRSGC